jgi:hypothetical protein
MEIYIFKIFYEYDRIRMTFFPQHSVLIQGPERKPDGF